MSASRFWPALEGIEGQSAVSAVWRGWLEEDFEFVRDNFLQRRLEPTTAVPCPRGCGCRHEVVANPGQLVAVCRCESWNCEDLELTPADVTVWELDRARLGSSLCAGLGFEPRRADLGIPGTTQIGSWSADTVPVLLAIYSAARRFRAAIAELAARLRRPFILLGPTNAHLDAPAQELLANAWAEFFALSAIVRFDGLRLHAARAPGLLFARFTPEPTPEPDENAALNAFAIVQKLDSGPRARAPSVLTVFRLYCIEQLSAERIARRCGCSKATVIGRLNLLRARLGTAPASLRRVSAHLAQIDEAASDPRARHIHRKNLVAEPGEEETG